ncbi:FLYWCH-type domain-containing protein [Aphis craccivora]|uniref:FLYWCH-type domain-containing protein n=1 Tax=Aphis craccivora TaxID=307492 RepID=A0A6G0YEI1_APHCR|nr:FLYWCH-type domain-containing protein [Aphis craccivora]
MSNLEGTNSLNICTFFPELIVVLSLLHFTIKNSNENAVLEKAQLSHITPNHIFAESMSIVPHEILIELSKEDHVKRTIIRNHRDYNDSSSVLKILHLSDQHITILLLISHKLH